MKLVVQPVAYSEELFAPLVSEARREDGSFLLRLREEWLSGELRFDGPGEVLLGAFVAPTLVGVAGISHDPYAPAAGLGRVRHLYVLEEHRRQGIGGALMRRLIKHGREHFTVLRLTTKATEAARLYESFGFVRCDAPKQTHRLQF